MRINDLTENTDAPQTQHKNPTLERLLESDIHAEQWTEFADFDSFMAHCARVTNG